MGEFEDLIFLLELRSFNLTFEVANQIAS